MIKYSFEKMLSSLLLLIASLKYCFYYLRTKNTTLKYPLKQNEYLKKKKNRS